MPSVPDLLDAHGFRQDGTLGPGVWVTDDPNGGYRFVRGISEVTFVCVGGDEVPVVARQPIRLGDPCETGASPDGATVAFVRAADLLEALDYARSGLVPMPDAGSGAEIEYDPSDLAAAPSPF